MANRMHEQVMDALATKLAAITTGNGYDITVATVEQAVKDPDETKLSKMPWLGIIFTSTDYEHVATNELDATATISLLGHVNETTPQTITNQLSDLENSIRRAIYSDINLGLTGMISSRVVSFETNESDPASPDAKVGTLLMTIEVKYKTEFYEA